MPTHVELITPARKLFTGEAEFVVLKAEGGDIMFLPNHADFVGAVDIGVCRIAASEPEVAGEVRAAMAGGFVHVANNHVTILAAVAELADDIDVPRAEAALQHAEAGTGPGQGPADDQPRSSAMMALLYPENLEVRARRARARLEAVSGTTAVPAAH